MSLAAAEGISPSAVSQRVRADGLAVILRTHEPAEDAAMTWLAVWLLGVGTADLLRAVDSPLVRRAAVPVGALAIVGVGLLAGLTGAADLVALVVSVVPLVGWVALSERSLRRGGGHAQALLVLGGTAVVLVATSGLERLRGRTPGRVAGVGGPAVRR